MGRAPCCDKANVKKGPWSPEEDAKLKFYIEKYGTGGNWIALPQKAGLKRCGKSCRLRWLNYLRPNIKHGEFSDEEDRIICSLYASIGSRWSIIAGQLQGRTDNDIKNYWNTKLKKKFMTNNNIITSTPNLSNLNIINQKKPYHNNQNQYHFLHHQYPMLLNHYSSSLSSPSSLLSHAISGSSIYNNNNPVCPNEINTNTYYDINNINNNNNSTSNNLLSFTECSYNNSSSSLNNTLIHMQNYQQHQLVKDNNDLLVFDHEHEHDHDHHHHHQHQHQHHHQLSSNSDDGSCNIITQINNNLVKQEDQIMYGVHHHQGTGPSNHDDHQHANQIDMIIDQKPSLCVNGSSNSSNIAGMWAQSSHCTTSAASKLNYGLEEIKELISTNNINVENFTYYDGIKQEEKDSSKMMYHYY